MRVSQPEILLWFTSVSLHLSSLTSVQTDLFGLVSLATHVGINTLNPKLEKTPI